MADALPAAILAGQQCARDCRFDVTQRRLYPPHGRVQCRFWTAGAPHRPDDEHLFVTGMENSRLGCGRVWDHKFEIALQIVHPSLPFVAGFNSSGYALFAR